MPSSILFIPHQSLLWSWFAAPLSLDHLLSVAPILVDGMPQADPWVHPSMRTSTSTAAAAAAATPFTPNPLAITIAGTPASTTPNAQPNPTAAGAAANVPTDPTDPRVIFIRANPGPLLLPLLLGDDVAGAEEVAAAVGKPVGELLREQGPHAFATLFLLRAAGFAFLVEQVRCRPAWVACLPCRLRIDLRQDKRCWIVAPTVGHAAPAGPTSVCC